MSKQISSKSTGLGSLIRSLRESKALPLRTVAAFLDIDQAILSKIERGQRKASQKQVINISKFFNADQNELLIAWLSDKLINEIEDESMALKALQMAEEKVIYNSSPKISKGNIINKLKTSLQNDKRIAAAWLFGSFARGDDKFNSDIDIMIELNTKKKYSMFDILDIEFLLQNKIKRKVDLVEKGYLNAFALKTAQKDLIKIYG